jgi:hypothetical protein
MSKPIPETPDVIIASPQDAHASGGRPGIPGTSYTSLRPGPLPPGYPAPPYPSREELSMVSPESLGLEIALQGNQGVSVLKVTGTLPRPPLKATD